MSAPILLVAFNRPDLTLKVIEAMRLVRPAKVFFAVDGPRQDRPSDAGLVKSVQELTSQIDWACEKRTLFNDVNLGCKRAVSRAISWFFEHVDEGIVLEDDCVPHSSFFAFSEELLHRFRHDERVMMISGNNFQKESHENKYSYYFSRYTHTWGWATWKRAWRLYDHRMSAWPELKTSGWLRDLLGEKFAAKYWEAIFDDTYAERNDAWDYRWLFSAWAQSGLTLIPSVNLVSNIGFGESATNTREGGASLAALPVKAMSFPIKHPSFLVRDWLADAYTQDHVFSSHGVWRRIASAARRRLGR